MTGKGTNDTRIPEFGSLEYWRNQARQMTPKEADEWRISEIATVLNDHAKLFCAHWQKINTIIEGNEDKSISVTFAVTLDRKNNPTEVSAKLGYSQKFGENLSGKVPDPDQTELPLESTSEVPAPSTDEVPET